MAVGLYIHVPFCRTRCHFCAFYLQVHREDRARGYLTSLEGEIRLHVAKDSLRGRSFDTVYFGGGTPTTLSPDQLDHILALIRAEFGLVATPEVTVEAHPDTVTAEGLHHLVQAGFTRISLGIQTVADQELIGVGRRTTGRPAEVALQAARAAGFGVVSVDLIYGLPAQSLASWMATLEEVLAWRPDHVSCYALTLEEHTHLALDVGRGNLLPPDPGLQNEMEEAAAERLAAAAFERYEISNYSRPGHRCRHNLLYWSGEDYVGLGPSAQSYLGGIRLGNVGDLGRYHQAIRAGRLPICSADPLTPKQRRREAVVFGLRLVEGVDRRLIEDHGADGAWRRALDQLTSEGLLEEGAGKIRLTGQGRRFADSVAVALI
jgi:oxygen-independent coproporphyrinogen-3 oxidase